ncbi:ABC transporter substrate-binding protein [Mycoplasmopsis felifaucium]|uniref:ABC transporter substrate-binding protein n=1 Tax=Mycoplasmopsis felifaucium TaxID=35768 RepID=UPI000488489A|nr:ABC transporter substrate-binding protein [Mycoplasmopsis felifaucium]
MKHRKILLNTIAVNFATSAVLISASCNKTNNNVRDYDLGLVSEPINSLNYIRFASVNRILPSLVESPLKTGPSESIKRILGLPEIQMGVYQNNNKPLDDYFNGIEASDERTGQYYDLGSLGSATGTLSADGSRYQPISVVMNNNKVQSMMALLNDGNSKWSNGDEVNADDIIDAIHYILDLSTGSQKLTSLLQRKFSHAQNVVDAQQDYIKTFGIAYKNPFQYPKLKNINGKIMYDLFDPEYKLFPSQIEAIKKSRKFENINKTDSWVKEMETKEAGILANLENAVRNLGLFSGRLYWNYSNKEILSSIPFSPDFDINADETIIMLPNYDYLYGKHTPKELENIPQRVPVKIKKYLFTDRRQKFTKEFNNLLKRSEKLKNRLNIQYSDDNKDEYTKAVNALYKENTVNNDFVNTFDAKTFRYTRQLALDEYSIRVEYSSSEPASVSNVLQDLQSHLIPINRKFVELNGGIAEFGFNKDKFLTNGAFNLGDVVLGPQGYVILNKDIHYYSSDKTMSNKIKIFFSSDPNINSALYSDQYIATTRIPAIQQLQYWTNLKFRKHMKKSSGFGTIALAFNLDKERYEKIQNKESLYIYDENLRNAIYYAINRNEMLNIVGWNSSYPVITWTAFGQGSSSFGDAIELAFDHDYMFTKVNDKIDIPVQNYRHLDHLSKSYNFEHVDRTDKAFHLDIARSYLELYKKAHPTVKHVKLRYISNSSDEQQNAGIALQDFMRKAFGDFVEIEIKSLPENVYEDFRTKGQFDLLYKNFDAFGTDAYSYIKVFFRPDGIDTKNAKETGFRNNPSGSWVYSDYFGKLGYKLDENNQILLDDSSNNRLAETTRKRLRIEKIIWDKMLELVFQKNGETSSQFTDRYTSFFTNQFTPKELSEGWTEQKAFGIIAALEKIVRDGAPVVPLMEVDTYWEISRVNGTDSLYTYSLQFAYDTARPPKPNLPTEVKEE